MMTLGLGLKDPPMQTLPALAVAAEQAGLTHLFSTELSIVQDAVTGRDPFLIAAAALSATSELRAGTGVVGTVFHSSRHLALSAATLAEQFPGRFVLGVGVAHQAFADHIGWPYPASPLTHVRACLADLREMRRNTLQFGADFPVWLAALGDRMVATSGSHADGVMLNWVSPQGARRVVAQDRPAGHKVAVLLRVGRLPQLLDGAATYLEMFANYRRHFERQGLRDPAEVVARTCLDVGDLAAAPDLLAEYADAGVDHLILYPADADVDLIHKVVGEAARWGAFS